MTTSPPVCDYEGSDYRTRFWENQGREYEDQVERIALRRLLPATGTTLIDIGAGFGRLADEYSGYQTVVLLDYSVSLLQEARARLGDDPRFLFVAANWYNMPFVDGLFEALVQVRTMHHAAEAPRLIAELGRIARPGGRYVLEYANKRNFKSIARYFLRRQSWSPFDPRPVEFVPLNFDFHPHWMHAVLEAAGFHTLDTLSVSHFRIGVLKRYVPTRLLVAADALAQLTGRWWQLSPSVFTLNRNPVDGLANRVDQFFACPRCGEPLGAPVDNVLLCAGCRARWGIENGVYNFKDPLG